MMPTSYFTDIVPGVFFFLPGLQFLLLFQETALNHVKTAGLLGDGFGATPEMSKRNLIWVVSKIQLLVDKYPSWYFAFN
jgi:hypothetical protein